jgi:hypothetical protein
VLLWSGLVVAALVLSKVPYFTAPITAQHSHSGLLPWTAAAGHRAASVLVLLAPLAVACLVMPAQPARRIAALSAAVAAGVLAYVFFQNEVSAAWAVNGMIAVLIFGGWLILRARSSASLALLVGAFVLTAAWYAPHGPGPWLQQVPLHLHLTEPFAYELWALAPFLLLVPLGFAAWALSRPAGPALSPSVGFITVALLGVAAAVVAVSAGAVTAHGRNVSAVSVPGLDATTPSPASGVLTSTGAVTTVQAFLDASAGGADPGLGWDCPGAAITPLAVSSYAIGDVSPATTGTFDVHASVTLTDGSTDVVVYRVDSAAAGTGCLATQTGQPAARTTPPVATPTASPAPAAPADVPILPSAAQPVRTDATPPDAPATATVIPYTDKSATPTRAGQLVEWQPPGLPAEQAAAVRAVIGFLTAVNRQDFTTAWNLTTEKLHGAAPDSAFTTGYATSRHYQVAFGQPVRLAADLYAIPARFVSRQDPAAQGNPPGVTSCTVWPQYVFLVAKVGGHWLDDVAADYTSRPEVAPLKRVDPASGRTPLNPPSQRTPC